ncbi:nitroreductase family protein [uncultured Duncaniella sp.]|uniref:nitroreductase family protein n=1 Tax=uncultured Duncaniella sp. TaxID=2768039 RepID=UPI0025A9420C|nr:nitroreductase family protein [uncultured Duncaniella sp.]
MEKISILAASAALSVIAVASSCSNNKTCQKASSGTDEAIANIMTRTSVRDYTTTPISEATIDTLLRAGMAAPTARNKQPWKFIVVNQRELLDSLAKGNWRPAAKAQAAIVVCGDVTDPLPGEGKDYWVQDCSAATENILLAAHAVGLGAVWCGCYPISERVDMVRSAFAIPDSIIPLSVVMLGYPTGPQEPKDKYKPENIHYNKW